MPLKTLVKVGNITNLSDARYCAGMGVDLLGFNVVAGTADHISPSLYQDIRGWISGPSIVAEIYSLMGTTAASVIEQYAPAYIETDFALFKDLKSAINLPFIVAAKNLTNEQIESHSGITYWIVDAENASAVDERYYSKLLVRVSTTEQVATILSRQSKPGIALSGSKEIRAGFKNYDDLAPFFDMLDE